MRLHWHEGTVWALWEQDSYLQAVLERQGPSKHEGTILPQAEARRSTALLHCSHVLAAQHLNSGQASHIQRWLTASTASNDERHPTVHLPVWYLDDGGKKTWMLSWLLGLQELSGP